MTSTRLLAAATALAIATMAGAQAPPRDATVGLAPPELAQLDPRPIDLTPAQRLAIYQSITQTGKNNAAPVGCRATVGARVPDSIELKPLSQTLAQLVPAASEMSIGMVEKQVILVDPSTRQVVAVVTEEPSNAVH